MKRENRIRMEAVGRSLGQHSETAIIKSSPSTGKTIKSRHKLNINLNLLRCKTSSSSSAIKHRSNASFSENTSSPKVPLIPNFCFTNHVPIQRNSANHVRKMYASTSNIRATKLSKENEAAFSVKGRLVSKEEVQILNKHYGTRCGTRNGKRAINSTMKVIPKNKVLASSGTKLNVKLNKTKKIQRGQNVGDDISDGSPLKEWSRSSSPERTFY